MDQVIDSVNNFEGLAFVRGFSEGISHTESTAWVRGDCYPRHVEVVTRFPVIGNSMVALVDQWRGRAYLSIGLIFPEDRILCYPKNRECPQLRGRLWGWRSKPGEIYTKTFNSNVHKDLSRQVPIAKHDCTITAGVYLRIWHNVKRKTIHVSINGREQFVSTCSNEGLNIYGYVRLRCEDNDSEIQVTLAPAIYDEAPTEVGFVETAPTNILKDFLISVGRKNHERFSWLLPDHAECKVTQDLSAESQRFRSYKMNSECPGICLLINNLKDSAREENLLTELFSSLAFNVEVKRRISMMEIIQVAQEVAKKDHSSYDSFVFILLSQCRPGEPIVGVDGREVILKQVMSEFRPCHTASLKNKPKLFFVLKFVDFRTQSTKRRNGGTEFCTDLNIALPNYCNTSIQEVCPEEADFLLACATSPIVKGKKIKQAKLSFTEMLVNAVRGYHQTYHLLEMLTLLNYWTKKLLKKRGQLNVMMPYVTHTLRHEVRFDSLQTDRPQVSALSYIPASSSLSRYDGDDTKCRGYCVIINNLEFQENEEAYRKGAEQDEKRLGNLFKSLRFKVIIKRNLEKNQIERVAQEYGGRNHDKFAAFFLIVMSHGDDRDCILGVDNRTTSVKALMREFQAERCPSLKGKPKILIIQTCRGSRQCDVERFDDFVESINADPTELDLADSCVGPFSLDSTLSKSVFPPEGDFLLAFATVPGYVAFRSEESGAFFIQELVEVIEKYHGSHHLLDILTEVTRRVIDHQNREFNSAAYRVQVPAPTHTLTKLLFL